MERTQATSAAIIAINQRPALLHKLGAPDLARLCDALGVLHLAALPGRAHGAEGYSLTAIAEGQEVPAVLFLEGAQELPPEPILEVMGRALALIEHQQATGVERDEREWLEKAMANNEWNVSRVARLLGVARQTVYNRLRRHGIEVRR